MLEFILRNWAAFILPLIVVVIFVFAISAFVKMKQRDNNAVLPDIYAEDETPDEDDEEEEPVFDLPDSDAEIKASFNVEHHDETPETFEGRVEQQVVDDGFL